MLVKPPNELDQEAEVQNNQAKKVPAKLRKERGNYTKLCLSDRRPSWMTRRGYKQNRAKKYQVGSPKSSFRFAIQLGHCILVKLRPEDGDHPRVRRCKNAFRSRRVKKLTRG